MNTQKTALLFIIFLAQALGEEDPDYCGWGWKDYAFIGAGSIAAVAAAPVVLSAAGFTSGGIAAGSMATKLMSMSATYGVGGSTVGALQSAGAAGLGYGGTMATGAVGATGAFFADLLKGCGPNHQKEEPKK